MTECERAATDLLAYLAGDQDVWDGYHVEDIAAILEPLAHFYLENKCQPSNASR